MAAREPRTVSDFNRLYCRIDCGTRDIAISNLLVVIKQALALHLTIRDWLPRSSMVQRRLAVLVLASTVAELRAERRSHVLPVVRGIIELSRSQ